MGCCLKKEVEHTGVLEHNTYFSEPEDEQHGQHINVVHQDPPQLHLAPSQCTIKWNHPNNTAVGTLTVAEVKLVGHNGTPYTFKQSDHFEVTICHEYSGSDDTGRKVHCIVEPDNLPGCTSIQVSFTVRISGWYTATFKINGDILSDVCHRCYEPGPPDRNKTVIHHATNNIILTCATFYSIKLAPKDCYGNISVVNEDVLFFEARQNGPEGEIVIPEHFVDEINSEDGCYEMLIKLDDPGYYNGCIKYLDTVLGLQNCNVYCLTEENSIKVQQNLQCRFLTMGHKARLISTNSTRTKKVKCFLSPRLLQIREYYLGIPSRIFTCRVCSSTQFIIHPEQEKFTLDDGLQPTVTLISPNRELIAATFHKLNQKNIGNAETFRDKQVFFQQELQQLNPGMTKDRHDVRITVKRFNLLQSAMQATKRFSRDMWKRQFIVTFHGEEGIDLGGVSREFFTCLCEVLFRGNNPRGLFAPFKDDPQALVHPNVKSRRDRELTLEHYEFAGKVVGKCLYESAQGNSLLVKAKFTRSFLAQIIGLRISWKHFESDDPDLYRFKVEYIKNNSLSDLELSMRFQEEEFQGSSNTIDPMLVSLMPGGSQVKVNDNNKIDYLNKLAQYRLVTTVSEEIQYFLKGLNDLIPSDLLVMFDENELELLMCGMQVLSVEDLRAHAQVRGSSDEFLRVVDWFWYLVEQQLSQEELARLVQFVTGSSQIPPEGFSAIQPPFLIASSGENNNRLPYAHTCFNHLCLPNYSSFGQFRTALITAINEGCEGVLLS